MIEVGIIADDLTGANATGALLAGQGLRVATCLGLAGWDEARLAAYDVLCVSTDSRLLPKEQAAQAVADVAGQFKLMRPRFVAKRIDSTLRGNLGAEIEAALTALGPETLAVVVPAFPASGRLAAGGYVIVNGVALEQTSVAKDPANPVLFSRYCEVIGQQTALEIGYVELDCVLKGPKAVARAITGHYARGARIVALDACSNQDIACIADSLKEADFPLLAVCPGPFTAALAKSLGAGSAREPERAVLLVIGSASELTRRQIENLRAACPLSLLKVDCGRLAAADALRAPEIDRIVRELREAGKTGQVLGVCTVERPEDVCSLEQLSREHCLALHEVSQRINSGLAEIAAKLLLEPGSRIGGLYTSGGEVTLAVARRLKAIGFSVRDEVLPLAVYGQLVEGDCGGLAILTKGGLVGDANALVTCVNYLRAKLHGRKAGI